AMTHVDLELVEPLAQLTTELRQVALVRGETNAIRRERRALALVLHSPALDVSDLVVQVLTADTAEIVQDLELLDGDLALVQGSAERVVRMRRHDQRSDDERGADGERHAACDELRAIQDPRPP